MQKYLFLMIALVGVLGFSGCTKDEDSYYNPNRTFIYTARPTDWKVNNNGAVSYDINLPELTDYYITDGFVSVAMSQDGEGSYDILPTTIDGWAYSANYTNGFVTITIRDPLADPSIRPTPNFDMVFKIVLSDSDFVP